jgi:hypothetical protein
MLLRGFALWLAGTLAAVPTPSPGAWLEWAVPQPPADCGDSGTFEQQLAVRLGRPPAQAAASLGISIDARIDKVAAPRPAWIGEIRVRHGQAGIQAGPEGVRRVERSGPSCQPLVDTLLLVATLILQQPSALPPPAPAVQAATDLELPRDEGSGPRARSAWSLALAAGPLTGLGALPAPYFGAQATALVRRGHLGVLLGGSLARRSGVPAAPGTGEGVDLSRAAFDAGWCPLHARRGPQTADLCAGVEVSRLHAAGFGFAVSATQDSWSVAGLAQAQARRQLWSALFLAVGLQLTVSPQRDRVAYADPTGALREIFQAAPVQGAGQLLVGLLF